MSRNAEMGRAGDLLDVVCLACFERRVLQVEFISVNGQRRKRNFRPLGYHVERGAVRVIVTDSARKLVKSFALSRVLKARLLSRRFKESPSLRGPSPAELKKLVRGNRFNTGRGLQAYFDRLHPAFKRAVGRLDSTGIYLDVGSGAARALEDYVRNAPRARAIGISIKTPPGTRKRVKDLIRSGGLELLETSLHTYAKKHASSIDLLSDLHGATAYGAFDRAVVDIAALLKPGAKAYFICDFVGLLDGRGEHITLATYLRTASGFTSKVIDGNRVEITRARGKIRLPKLRKLASLLSDEGLRSIYRVLPEKISS